MKLLLQFEGIRCFATSQSAEVRPLTLLVGENSAGKSTFLALNRIASWMTKDLSNHLSLFNDPPFVFGAYDQIASYRRGSAVAAKSFSLSVCVEDGDRRAGALRVTFGSKDGQAVPKNWRVSAGEIYLEVELRNNPKHDSLTLGSSKGTKAIEIAGLPFGNLLRAPSGLVALLLMRTFDVLRLGPIFSDSDAHDLRSAFKLVETATGLPYAFAPTRTNPERTYDPVGATPVPEGSHVPMLLANMSRSSSRGEWAGMQSGLDEFGASSGLFERIDVIRKGKKESDPFQIGVKSGGHVFNLVDVGYGVSQVLPVVVDIQRSQPNAVFLMQQPEVHLHPRAQAELGSFLSKRAAHRRFVVETHSDYLVDRIRMEVRRGELKPTDVALLYFERQKNGARIHTLDLDERGAIMNAPPGYRQFFLNETRTLLDF